MDVGVRLIKGSNCPGLVLALAGVSCWVNPGNAIPQALVRNMKMINDGINVEIRRLKWYS